MRKKELLKQLDFYREQYPKERATVDKFIKFISEFDDCFERTQKFGHITGSGLVTDKSMKRVLLTHHKKLNKWLQLGGHADGNPNIIEVAQKEVIEDSGINDTSVADDNIFDIDAHLIPARKKEPEHYHFDIRYLFLTNSNENYIISDESHDLKWIPVDQVRDYNTDENIIRMIEKLKFILR